MKRQAGIHNEIGGDVHGTVVQAGVVHLGTPPGELLRQMHDAQRQLLVGQRAEQRSALLISILYLALARAFRLIGEVTREYDRLRTIDGDATEAVERRLGGAQETHDRTRRQLERAEAERRRAADLVSIIGRRIVALQCQLLDQEPARAIGFRIATELDELKADPEYLLEDITAGLDRIDRLLDVQGEELEQLDLEITKWSNEPAALHAGAEPVEEKAERQRIEAERWHQIVEDHLVSPTHRVKAAWEISWLGKQNFGDAEHHLRSIIVDRSVTHSVRLSAVDALGRFSSAGRREAVEFLCEMIADNDRMLIERIQAAQHLGDYGEEGREFAVSFLKKVAETAATSGLQTYNRVDAARAWWALSRDEKERVLAALRDMAGHEELADYERNRIDEFIHEVRTDPRA